MSHCILNSAVFVDVMVYHSLYAHCKVALSAFVTLGVLRKCIERCVEDTECCLACVSVSVSAFLSVTVSLCMDHL